MLTDWEVILTLNFSTNALISLAMLAARTVGAGT